MVVVRIEVKHFALFRRKCLHTPFVRLVNGIKYSQSTGKVRKTKVPVRQFRSLSFKRTPSSCSKRKNPFSGSLYPVAAIRNPLIRRLSMFCLIQRIKCLIHLVKLHRQCFVLRVLQLVGKSCSSLRHSVTGNTRRKGRNPIGRSFQLRRTCIEFLLNARLLLQQVIFRVIVLHVCLSQCFARMLRPLLRKSRFSFALIFAPQCVYKCSVLILRS